MKAPSVVRASLLLLWVRLHLKARGFGPSVAAARRWAGSRPSSESDPALVEKTALAVALAAAFFPGRAVCLEQSLSLYVLLRRRGVDAELKLGVQPFPFLAHAWVEVDGAPVNEEPEVVASFVPMAAGAA